MYLTVLIIPSTLVGLLFRTAMVNCIPTLLFNFKLLLFSLQFNDFLAFKCDGLVSDITYRQLTATVYVYVLAYVQTTLFNAHQWPIFN